MPDYASARRTMVDTQLLPSRVEDPRVIQAMQTIPREVFVPRALKGVAYNDEDLDLGDGRRLIEPLALGKLIEGAGVRPDDVALVIGCDTGYVAAVLGRLCATVFLLLPPDRPGEPVERLLNELECDNVVVQNGPVAEGLSAQAPFDLILLAGAVSKVPDRLLAQLADGGRLATVLQDGRAGRVTICHKIGSAIGRTQPFDAWLPELEAFREPAGFVF
jgi:protein-L-isoaspartate(D-aspartate) O-methyltransferase